MIAGILIALVVLNLVIVGGVCFLWGHQKYVSVTVVDDVAEIESDVAHTLQDFREAMNRHYKELEHRYAQHALSDKLISELKIRVEDTEQSILTIKGRMK